jgi:hypothetical protein
MPLMSRIERMARERLANEGFENGRINLMMI